MRVSVYGFVTRNQQGPRPTIRNPLRSFSLWLLYGVIRSLSMRLMQLIVSMDALRVMREAQYPGGS